MHVRGKEGALVENKWCLGSLEKFYGMREIFISYRRAIFRPSWFLFKYYYLLSGLIKAIQLDYSEADKHLSNAIRKAPQNTAVGFKQTVSLTFFMAS